MTPFLVAEPEFVRHRDEVGRAPAGQRPVLPGFP